MKLSTIGLTVLFAVGTGSQQILQPEEANWPELDASSLSSAREVENRLLARWPQKGGGGNRGGGGNSGGGNRGGSSGGNRGGSSGGNRGGSGQVRFGFDIHSGAFKFYTSLLHTYPYFYILYRHCISYGAHVSNPSTLIHSFHNRPNKA
jgi:hypothetical protein